ncbi:MAG: helix-turn-helix transcriptional regulator [Candidatus Desulforudis sp.]|nr:helix-turn-helix transcriptional regulator [Desulforudis sp.]
MDGNQHKSQPAVEDLALLQAHTEKLMWPCLLFLLYRKPAHGYELIQNLNEMGLSEGEADPATVYRNLRRLEEEHLVASHWETGTAGPARRLYQLTPAGRRSLHVFARLLTEKKRQLEEFLHRYQEIIRASSSGSEEEGD